MEIVAEISGNHGGKIENAYRLIKAATKADADAVKFQCFEPERIAARRAKNPAIILMGHNYDSLLKLYQQTHTPKEWFPRLIHAAGEHGLDWFSSVFDPEDVAFLETLDCPRYKISAFEMLDWDIIKAVKETGKPVVISVRPRDGVTILHASNYDGTFPMLGISSHGIVHLEDMEFPMVEWHLKLEDVPSPDDAFSLTPEEFENAVRAIR